MMDNFEKYIRENRERFDEHRADRSKMWSEIEQKLSNEQKKVIPLWRRSIIQVAAAVLLLIGLSGIIGITFYGNNQTGSNTFVSQELNDIDTHYQCLVAYQVNLIKENKQLSEAEKTEFLSFMDDLDREYDELKVEMRNNLDNELLLEAIIANYKKRIELIENLLRQLNESKIKEEDYGYTL